MITKTFFAALALTGALAAPALAQDGKTKSDAEKTKTTADGMTTKTKMADDGKMKVKGKSDAGDKMKAKTKPRQGDAMGGTMSTTTTTTSTTSTSGVMVGGAMMTPDKDIVDNAVGSADHTTLVAAVKAAGLVETLKGAGPFTVFAPANSAFDKLPAGTVNSLVTPEMKPTLTKILTYHVVPGRLTADQLSNGQVLTTVEGEQLTVMKSGSSVMLKDAKGGMATVTIPNVISSNGVTHVIDTVLMPAK
ncbi:fasciclin domain-containing protein [Hymenobacter sp. BT523]|nr:fasciclin domain-containing protein [Hymenobacter sp. BT523]